ncbi:sugar kinase [Sphingobium sufflavum]|uniref:sugar kinase n=1 Tax=Sphingobium sufflavum TaxID=1129547 RepID=UPI001F1CFF32|nr:sugar kinase [Sphingobium sufflavum]MCE7796391.1 sugar kinase [Sphingobium sufflavum]
MTRICLIGEGMVELSGGPARGWAVGHGGDTLNTGIHLARMGHDVAYATALGDDAFSAGLRDSWAAEGLDLTPTLTAAGRMPGLYAIQTDDAGERSFAYWRGESAARSMFDLPDSDRLIAQAGAADLLVYSLITLAILSAEGRGRLFSLCDAVRARGGRVAFDGNYRPRLWPDAATARAARDAAIARCDIGLPTLADEVEMGEADDAAATAARWSALGCAEPVVKLGVEGCLVAGQTVPPPARVTVVDSSGAGDAFNAGYLSARIGGAVPVEAALAGHRLAGWAIGHAGAIPARKDDAPY